MARSPGRATARIKALTTHAGAPTKSVFEDAFLAFVDHHDLPRPEVNEEVAGHEVDMLWRERRLVIELDSRAHHDTPQAFEADRARDADLLIAGFSVARLTWHRFTTEPAQVRALISRT